MKHKVLASGDATAVHHTVNTTRGGLDYCTVAAIPFHSTPGEGWTAVLWRGVTAPFFFALYCLHSAIQQEKVRFTDAYLGEFVSDDDGRVIEFHDLRAVGACGVVGNLLQRQRPFPAPQGGPAGAATQGVAHAPPRNAHAVRVRVGVRPHVRARLPSARP